MSISKKSLIAAIIFLALFAALSVFVVNGSLNAFNITAAAQIQALENPALTVILKIFTYLGEWYVYIPAALILIFIPKTRYSIGLPAGIVLLAAWALNNILKFSFRIPRPNVHRLVGESGYGYPSGHAMTGAAFLGILAYCVYKAAKDKGWRWVPVYIASVLILLIGFSRIYLGVHSPTDVIGGFLAGLSIFAFAVAIMEKAKNKQGKIY